MDLDAEITRKDLRRLAGALHAIRADQRRLGISLRPFLRHLADLLHALGGQRDVGVAPDPALDVELGVAVTDEVDLTHGRVAGPFCGATCTGRTGTSRSCHSPQESSSRTLGQKKPGLRVVMPVCTVGA